MKMVIGFVSLLYISFEQYNIVSSILRRMKHAMVENQAINLWKDPILYLKYVHTETAGHVIQYIQGVSL